EWRRVAERVCLDPVDVRMCKQTLANGAVCDAYIADCPDRIAGLSVLDTTLSVGKPDGIVVEVANDRPNVLCWLFEDGAVIGLCHNAAPCLVPRQAQNGAACRLSRFVCCLIAVRPNPMTFHRRRIVPSRENRVARLSLI